MRLTDELTTCQFLSWVQLGDLHIKTRDHENYSNLRAFVAEIRDHVANEIDFVFLPGDNADDGTEEQYQLIREAINELAIPVEAIAGDHDKMSGSLSLFEDYLEAQPYRSIRLGNFQLLFLNALDVSDDHGFDMGMEQLTWLRCHLGQGRQASLRPLIFHHLYPSELATQGKELARLIRQYRVELVEMGHTHYNEIANDGCTIYTATRSTGQTEEGPPGISVTTLDGDAISWRFKERAIWPLVLITSPVDRRLITKPESPQHLVHGTVRFNARVWGADHNLQGQVSAWVDGRQFAVMSFHTDHWECQFDSKSVTDGFHQLSVRYRNAFETIEFLVSQSGYYLAPKRYDVDLDNSIGDWRERGILGTQLGPNRNGTKSPWPSWAR